MWSALLRAAAAVSVGPEEVVRSLWGLLCLVVGRRGYRMVEGMTLAAVSMLGAVRSVTVFGVEGGVLAGAAFEWRVALVWMSVVAWMGPATYRLFCFCPWSGLGL